MFFFTGVNKWKKTFQKGNQKLRKDLEQFSAIVLTIAAHSTEIPQLGLGRELSREVKAEQKTNQIVSNPLLWALEQCVEFLLLVPPHMWKLCSSPLALLFVPPDVLRRCSTATLCNPTSAASAPLWDPPRGPNDEFEMQKQHHAWQKPEKLEGGHMGGYCKCSFCLSYQVSIDLFRPHWQGGRLNS